MPGAFAFASLLVSWELRWILLQTQYPGLSVQPAACRACGTQRAAFCQFVVGASRRSAAPGGQSFGSQLLAGLSSAFTHRATPAKVEACSCQVFPSGLSSAALAHFGHRGALPARDAQPFNREDLPRQAGSSLSSQTLGLYQAREKGRAD